MTSRILRGSSLRVLLAVGLAVAVLAPGAPVSAAQLTLLSQAAAWPAENCGTGSQLNLPVSTSVDSDGWIRMNYDVDGAQSFKEFPPAGFSASASDDSLLARHHLPTRPQAAGDLAQWTSRWSNLSWARTRGICRDLGPSNSWYSTTNPQWGGVAVQPQTNYNFVGVQGYFTQPTAQLNPYCPDSTLSSWVGLGGLTGGALAQVGTQTAFDKGALPVVLFAEYVLPGSFDYHYTWGNVAPGDTTLFFLVQIYSGGLTAFDTIDHGVLTTYYMITSGVSGSADWVDEANKGRPMNYGTTHWSGMYQLRSNSSSWFAAYSEPNQARITMMLNGRTLTTTTGVLSNNSMQDTFRACGQ